MPMPDAEPGPGAMTGAALLELVAVMDRLRRECPWDAKQTHLSLAPHLLEETYEALEALEQQDPVALAEELGDVLLQVLFHARVAAERTDGTGFTIDDVAAGIAAKLIRRHPHVFADVSVSGADEVKRNWDQIKQAERAERAGQAVSVLDGVPMGQPALSLAAQLLRRAGAAGAPAELADLLVSGRSGLVSGQSGPVSGQSGPPASPEDGIEADAQAKTGAGARTESVSAIGAELFAVAAKARASGLDPELELRHAARVYRDRVRDWEQRGD
jgi:NTP pyrophosphatase (non-canonical NTP hydrolase)